MGASSLIVLIIYSKLIIKLFVSEFIWFLYPSKLYETHSANNLEIVKLGVAILS